MPKSMDMAHKLAYSLLCRVVVSNCKPNRGHYAIAALENRCRKEGKVFTLLTQVYILSHISKL